MAWGRIFAGAALAEVLIFAGDGLVLAVWGEGAIRYSASVWSFVMTLLAAMWISKRPTRSPVWHGALMGVLAAGLFTLLTLAPPRLEDWIAHGMKVLGGAAGGRLAHAATPRPHSGF